MSQDPVFYQSPLCAGLHVRRRLRTVDRHGHLQRVSCGPRPCGCPRWPKAGQGDAFPSGPHVAQDGHIPGRGKEAVYAVSSHGRGGVEGFSHSSEYLLRMVWRDLNPHGVEGCPGGGLSSIVHGTDFGRQRKLLPISRSLVRLLCWQPAHCCAQGAVQR